MKTVNMHEAKTHLSRLVEAAVAGEPFIIAKAGKPMVKVSPIEEPLRKPRRMGFMVGEGGPIPKDFFSPELDKEIEDLFLAEDPLLEDPPLNDALDAWANAQKKPE